MTCYTRIKRMTAYHFTRTTKTILPSPDVQEKKAARKKLLDAVFQRRAEIYKRFSLKKRQLQADSDLL